MDNGKETGKSDRTDWHRLWGLMMTPLFERLGCETVVEMDLSAKIQRLDMVVVTAEKGKVHYDLMNPDYYEGFENLNEHNLISFKSFREVFNMTALEEFYGHFTNYRKMKNIGEDEKHKVNLYAVTFHFPKELFARFQGTGFLRCVKENQIYDLNILTPVRFVITRGSRHPVLGLFSDDPEQIASSRRRLEHDGWLVREVSSYLQQLYKHYSMEGIDMPYTKEMFIRDYYPEWYEKILAAKAEGKAEGKTEGKAEGKLIGEILFCQRILKKSLYSQEALEAMTFEELKRIASDMEAKLTF